MNKINPCPLCGSEPVLTVYSGYINGVVCGCGLAVEVGATTGDEAINGWNDVTANFTQPVKTLRDEFAMAALNGAIAANSNYRPVSYDDLAADCYSVADAMLKERGK